MGKSVNELYELFDRLYDIKARAAVEKGVAARKKLKRQIVNGVNDFLPAVSDSSPGSSSENGGRVSGENLAELKKIERKAEELREWALRNL